MNIQTTPRFRKTLKRLRKNQKLDLDRAVKDIMQDPQLGDLKKGDLSFLRVVKFKMAKQLTLLGYEYDEAKSQIILHALGSHENFYRDIKRS